MHAVSFGAILTNYSFPCLTASTNMLSNFALPFFFALRACAELFQTPADLPSNVTYDYIVVGGDEALLCSVLAFDVGRLAE